MIQSSNINIIILEANAIAGKITISEIILKKKLNKGHIIQSLQMAKISSAFLRRNRLYFQLYSTRYTKAESTQYLMLSDR